MTPASDLHPAQRLRNYITYAAAYHQQATGPNKKATPPDNEPKIWTKQHPYNIEQRVRFIIQHFCQQIQAQVGNSLAVVLVPAGQARLYCAAMSECLERTEHGGLSVRILGEGDGRLLLSADTTLEHRRRLGIRAIYILKQVSKIGLLKTARELEEAFPDSNQGTPLILDMVNQLQ